MTTATLSAAQAVHRERLFLRRWLPQSRHYREKWLAWRRDCEHLAGTPNPRERLCRHCGRVNKTGEAASAFLHWACYQALVIIDAREAQREAAPPDSAEPWQPAGSRAVLMAAVRTLPQPVSYADLVLAAWRADPDAFGLKGAEHGHPSDHRVRAALDGIHGLVRRGLLTVERGRYVVTPAGRALAGKGVG